MASLFIFRTDYRLKDNTSLIECCKNNEKVYPIFIFTPEQIDSNKNKFKSDNAVQILVESLLELNDEIKSEEGKLNIYYGDVIKVLNEILKKLKVKNIYFNKDYTPYSKKRDNLIQKFCKDNEIDLITLDDMLLYDTGLIKTKTGDPHTIFGFYLKEAKKIKIQKPQSVRKYNFSKSSIKTKYSINTKKMNDFYEYNENLPVNGGRKNALKILSSLDKFKSYDKTRDFPIIGNTFLSSLIRFGVVSLRECYWKFRDTLGVNSGLVTQLYWNSFYTELGNNFPNMYKDNYLRDEFKDIKWEKDKKLFDAWKDGKTGFPLSDAGMREMNSTGFMHNRVRMVSATLLSRVLLLDWRMGEQYFSKKLIDHNRSNNEGNWFWVVGTANHSQVYFRIMSEWSQIKRFDKDCEYIKKWIPELKEVPNKDILKWNQTYKNYEVNYPGPIVDDKKNREESINRYKKSKDKN